MPDTRQPRGRDDVGISDRAGWAGPLTVSRVVCRSARRPSVRPIMGPRRGSINQYVDQLTAEILPESTAWRFGGARSRVDIAPCVMLSTSWSKNDQWDEG